MENNDFYALQDNLNGDITGMRIDGCEEHKRVFREGLSNWSWIGEMVVDEPDFDVDFDGVDHRST